MLKSERKKIVFKEFDEYLKPLNFKGFKSGGDPAYLLKFEDRVISFFMNFKDAQWIAISGIKISILLVEQYIIEIFGKDYIMEKYFYDKKKYFLTTINDKNFTNKFDSIELNTEYEIINFTNWYIKYLETDGQKFIETYSYLPNILKKMDELVDTGGYWSDLLTGGVPHLFKGLIISKLCNDPNFCNKIIFVDNIFATEDISEYLPYYEKLKERLKSVEPIYNV
ncbi:hypothetical protein [Capnocytophaga sputigena]|uniref:hypothetical protein n=1 Tax=Capnocytophaga sputigena TaxID=1019 RepID=UPI000BB59BB4|nr:hypothetical protein [Capnocytophaga sputigena]PBN46326.1 hypothetical protein CDC50_09980 [Capnocytophaga sputigena]